MNINIGKGHKQEDENMQRAIIASVLLGLAGLLACTRETPPPEAMPRTAAAQRTAEQKLQYIHADIQVLKVELAQAKKYSCCIHDGCNYCLLHEGSCPCLSELESGRHVCVECYAGWQQGKGAAEGIQKEEVTTSFVKHEHKH